MNVLIILATKHYRITTEAKASTNAAVSRQNALSKSSFSCRIVFMTKSSFFSKVAPKSVKEERGGELDHDQQYVVTWRTASSVIFGGLGSTNRSFHLIVFQSIVLQIFQEI